MFKIYPNILHLLKFFINSLIEEFNLRPINVYCEVGKILAKFEKYNGISQLVSSIKQLGTSSEIVNNMCDEMLTSAVATLTKANCSETKVENLIKLMTDRAKKVKPSIDIKIIYTSKVKFILGRFSKIFILFTKHLQGEIK